MSLMEIFDYIEAKRRKEHEERKWLIRNMYIMAQVNAEHIGNYISKDVTPRMLWDIYPGEFEEDRIHAEQYQMHMEEEQAKANRLARAEAAAQQRFIQEMEELEKEEGGG